MRFYYISIFSVILLAVIYFIGTGLLVWLGTSLRKRWKHGWIAVMPLFLLLYIAPLAEEFWIAWNFGKLCKKDAGIFVYKTVEVEGFYDVTRSTHDGPRTPQAVEEYEKMGYEFYEKKFRDTGRVVHIEKEKGAWAATVFDHPTARYHFTKPHNHTTVAHKIKMFEYLVEDKKMNEVLAREKTYARQAPWFFVGLDRPTRFCAVSGDYGEKIHATLYDLALKPASRSLRK